MILDALKKKDAEDHVVSVGGPESESLSDFVIGHRGNRGDDHDANEHAQNGQK